MKKSSQEVDRGHDGSGPYRGGKYESYEGGTRVPLIVSWPKRIKPGVTDALFSQIDLLASLASLNGVELKTDEAIDSRNMLPTLLGEDKEGLPQMIEEARGLALRKGRWKYIEGKAGKGKTTKGRLYSLKEDLEERVDVAEEYPEILAQMRSALQQLKSPRGVRETAGNLSDG